MRCIGLSIVSLTAVLVVRAPADEKKPPPTSDTAKFEPFQILWTLETEARVATAVAFSPDGKLLAVGDGQMIRFWNPRTGKEVIEAWKNTDGARAIVFVDANTVAIARPTQFVSLREYPSGKEVATLDMGNNQSPISLAVNSGLLVVGSDGSAPQHVGVWSGPKWQQTWRVELSAEDSPISLAISPDRREVAVGTGTGRVRVYSGKEGKALRDAGGDKLVLPSPRGIAFSPKGDEVAVAPTARDEASRRTDDIWGLAIFDAGLSKHRAILRWGRPGGSPLGCAFTPDGKTLVVPCRGNTVRVYEVETGGLRHVGGVAFDPFPFALSPDGRLFAAGGKDVSVIDWRTPKLGSAVALDATILDAVWADLASPDSAKGFKAVVALSVDPKKAAKFIGEKLKPVPVPKAEAVKVWVADLGSDDFATREAAEKELAKLGDAVEVELREAAKSDVPERRDRAGKLLKALSRRDSPERLRILRAVEVLEYADTPAGREVLKSLAGGAPSALLTRDAKAALARLQALDPKP